MAVPSVSFLKKLSMQAADESDSTQRTLLLPPRPGPRSWEHAIACQRQVQQRGEAQLVKNREFHNLCFLLQLLPAVFRHLSFELEALLLAARRSCGRPAWA